MNIFVGNLNYRVQKEALEQLFGEYGEVESVKLITDRETGRARGFGFVVMSDDDAARLAIENLNGTQVMGRALVVNEARPRQ